MGIVEFRVDLTHEVDIVDPVEAMDMMDSLDMDDNVDTLNGVNMVDMKTAVRERSLGNWDCYVAGENSEGINEYICNQYSYSDHIEVDCIT